jgi:hypothetical protein
MSSASSANKRRFFYITELYISTGTCKSTRTVTVGVTGALTYSGIIQSTMIPISPASQPGKVRNYVTVRS